MSFRKLLEQLPHGQYEEAFRTMVKALGRHIDELDEAAIDKMAMEEMEDFRNPKNSTLSSKVELAAPFQCVKAILVCIGGAIGILLALFGLPKSASKSQPKQLWRSS